MDPLDLNEKTSTSNENLSEDDKSNSSNQSKTFSKLKICENLKKSLNPLLEDDESNSSNQNKTTSKLKICENIKQSLDFEERDNAGANLKPMRRGEARSTGNFLRSLSENIFSKPVVNVITPTKTKDITKIKGWKKKRFVESDEKTPSVSKDSSFIRTQEESALRDKSAFISEQLDQFLSNAPKSYHTANGIKEAKSSSDYIISSTDTMPSVSTVFSTSNIIDCSSNPTPSTSTADTVSATSSNTSTTATVLTTSPNSIEFVSFPDHNNITTSPTSNTTAISTTSIMPTSNSLVQSEKSIDSNISTVSTIPTPIPSISSVDSITNGQTDTNILSYSTFGETIKPYKPKTLAEKRRLLEESKLPLTPNLLHSMSREQRQINRSRILNFYNQLINSEVPFDRDSYKISSDIVNTYSYIVCNGKRLKVTSSKKDKVIANIKYRRKTSKPKTKPSYIPASNETSQLAPIVKKPSLLESLKEPLENGQFDSSEWETVEVKLPKVFLSVVPQYNQVLHPNLEHLIGNETWLLSENRVKFALSLLRTKNAKSKLHTFKFPLVFPNKQETMEMKRKKPVADKIEDIKIIENDDEIQEGVNSVMYKLLNYVDVLDETEKLNISNDENVESSIDEPILTVATVDRPIRRQAAPRSKINKTALEMKRLNCKIVSVANDEESVENENCTKEVCKLGCICKTLRCDSKNLVPLHCGSWKCIFKCRCKNNNNMDKTLLPSGYNLLNAGVINRLQDQAKKNLAKVEKEFTQTIIKTDNQLIMVGDSKERRRRVTKTPKKYNDFLNEDLTDTVESDSHQLSTDDESFLALPSDCYDVKPCSVSLYKYNFNDIIPFCIIHWMYKCDCMSKSDSANLISIPSASHYTPVLAPHESHTVKKSRKKYTFKIPRPHSNGFVKPRVREKYSRKQRDDKTFNKEEFCSRTRGLSTSYYIPRNTMDSQLENMLKSSKRFSRDLSRYVRSLRVKLNEINRTSKLVDPIQAEKDEIERDLIHNTIERLTLFLPAENHLDKLLSRLYQRMNGIITPETMRKKRQLEIQPTDPKVSQDTSEAPPSNSLSAIINCYRTNSDNIGDQSSLLCPNNMYSSKQKEFRLLPWTSLLNNYNKKSIEIWYLNTTKISPIIITQRNTRPSVNHCNIRVFEHLPEEASIPLDFIRCVVHNKVPMNKNPENIFVILSFNENNCSELYSVCEKSLATDKVKIRVALLQQIKETPSAKDIDIESVAKENNDEVMEEDEKEEILQGEFLHYGQQNEKVLLTYCVQKFPSHTFNYENVSSPFFETKRDVRLPLPRETGKCRWRLIHCDLAFLYLRLSCNKFTIKYCDIMKVVQLARNKRKTVIITSDDIKKGHRHQNFGIFCVPNYVDKIFIGPYLTDEDHHVDIFVAKVLRQGMLFETVMIDTTNGLWVNQIDDNQDNSSSGSSSGNTESCIDLTKDEEELTTILKNSKCNNLLQILGFSSDSIQNNDNEDATNYEEDAYWNDLHLYMTDADFQVQDFHPEIKEKVYYSLKNKGAIRYFISNVPGLGYIKAFLHEITNDVDIVCPLTNTIRRFSSYNAALNGITRMLVQNLIIVPLKIGLRVRMLAKLNPTMKTALSSTVLDGYHMVGDFGVKSVRDTNIEELKIMGLTDNEIEFVLVQRRKRLIFDLTNRLAQNFSLEGTSPQRSHGDVLTEVIKKIISTIKLSTAGSSIKNIEKSFKLINLYPTTIRTKIYKQLEYVAYNFKKKELSTAELQKIRMSPQKRKSVSPKPPIASSGKSTNSETSTFKRIRLYPQPEDPLNLEAQGGSSTNVLATKELSTSQFQRIRLSKREILSKPDVELKPISSKKEVKFKEIRRSLPNEKFTISKLQDNSNSSTNDVIITKLNRLHSFGTTVVANSSNSEKKTLKSIEDDVIVIEAEPPTKSKLTSLLRNQQQPELKKRTLQLEDNVVIQPEPKRLKNNITNDVVIQPELKNHITQHLNGATTVPNKAVVQNNIVVARTQSTIQKRLQVMLANGNTTSLLKGKYINLLPLKSDGENKYVILPNKDKIPTKFKRVSDLQNGRKLLVTPKNGKSLLVPQSTNITPLPLLTKLPVKKVNKVLLPKMTPLSDLKSTPQKPSSNLVLGKEKNSSFITIQSGETTKCFKVLNRKMNSVKKVIKGQVVRPSHELPK